MTPMLILSAGQQKQSSLQTILLTRWSHASTPWRRKCKISSKYRADTAGQVHGRVHYAVPSSKLRRREPL